MKLVTVILGLIILLSVPLSAGAITLINKEVILEAQDYGAKRSKLPLSDFLQPWLAYEEHAAIINETTERAYLYTPFLLLAYDARDKAISKQSIELADSEQILADYAGCLVFSIIVNGNTEKFSDNVQVTIKQEKKIIKPYHAVINPPVKKPWAANEPHYTAHYYFYFYEQDVVLSKPITLTVTTKDKQERHFYFELPNFK